MGKMGKINLGIEVSELLNIGRKIDIRAYIPKDAGKNRNTLSDMPKPNIEKVSSKNALK